MSEDRAPISVVRGTYEPCEECGASLDAQQRYCVSCGARRGNGANPSSRYFAAMSKKARRPLSRPAPKSPTSRAAAVGFFALLPIAVALGVVVGRSDGGGEDNEALLQALREQDAAATSTASTGTAAAAAGKGVKNGKGGKNKKGKGGGEGKVVAQTKNGEVHQVTGFKASEEKVEEDTQIVAENPEQVGDNYIKAQQNLPDVVVVGGEPGAAPAPAPSGVEP